MIVHNVLFKLKDPDDISAAVDVLKSMDGQIDELRHLEVGVDLLGSERSFHIALVTKFDTWADFETYRTHPKHKPVLAHMATVTEQAAVVDYEI